MEALSGQPVFGTARPATITPEVLAQLLRDRFASECGLASSDLDPHLVEVVRLSSIALVQSMEAGDYDDALDDVLAVETWLTINTLPVAAMDELGIVLAEVAWEIWPDDRPRAVEAAKRIGFASCEGFWPFEHPAAVTQAARFGSLADRIPAPVFVADSQLSITFASAELDGLMGGRGPALGQTVEQVFGAGPWSDSALKVPVEISGSGGTAHIEVTVIPTLLLDGVEYFGFVRDRTREAMLEEIRDGVVGSISHELRTPLTAIIGYLELLTEGALDAEGSLDAIDIAKSEADLLLRLVADIVDFSKFTSGSAELLPSRFRVIEQVDAALRRVFRTSDVQVKVDVPDDLHLVADAHRVAQVLTNLLTNARRYGGQRVTVGAKAIGDAVVIEVSDNGHGIPADEIDHIFKPFVQGTARHTGDGAGLGLAICSGIVSSHGGTIIVQNDRGAHFFVSFPNRNPE